MASTSPDHCSLLANFDRPEVTREWCLMGELGLELEKEAFRSGGVGMGWSSKRESRPIIVFSSSAILIGAGRDRS